MRATVWAHCSSTWRTLAGSTDEPVLVTNNHAGQVGRSILELVVFARQFMGRERVSKRKRLIFAWGQGPAVCQLIISKLSKCDQAAFCLQWHTSLNEAEFRFTDNLVKKLYRISRDYHMTPSTKEQFIPRTRATMVYTLLRRTALVAGLLLPMMPFLASCGGAETDNTTPVVAPVGATVSFGWDPVEDHSVHAYFVHYGRKSPGQSGSCLYESSLYTESPSAMITNLDRGTLYYFAVSSYNDHKSPCSEEVSIVIPSSSG